MPAPPRPTLNAGYLPTLDGWRAAAIGMVIVAHAKSHVLTGPWASEWLVRNHHYTVYGVNLFFAISGFLICNRLLVEHEVSNRISLRLFYVRRTFRILPLYYLYLVALAVLGVAAGVDISAQELLRSAVFLRNYAPDHIWTYTQHLWSLAVEEHFYLAWPLLTAVLGPRRLLLVTPALALAVHGWRAIDSRYHLFAQVFFDSGIYYRTDTRVDGILWGCFAALLWHRFPTRRLPAAVPYLALAALVAAVGLKAPALPLVTSLLFPLLIVGTVQNPNGLLGRSLELAPVRWVGRLSYSLYIWQTILLVPPQGGPDPAWLAAVKATPAAFPLILASAAASHYLIERPMIRLGRRAAARFQPLPKPGRF